MIDNAGHAHLQLRLTWSFEPPNTDARAVRAFETSDAKSEIVKTECARIVRARNFYTIFE
jgi:hypothetical protein